MSIVNVTIWSIDETTERVHFMAEDCSMNRHYVVYRIRSILSLVFTFCFMHLTPVNHIGPLALYLHFSILCIGRFLSNFFLILLILLEVFFWASKQLRSIGSVRILLICLQYIFIVCGLKWPIIHWITSYFFCYHPYWPKLRLCLLSWLLLLTLYKTNFNE